MAKEGICMTLTAFFVKRPRRIDDLQGLHLTSQERPYEVVKRITLGKMDYENFTTDLLADRAFLDGLDTLCSTGTVWRCIFVRQRGQKDGVLIVPSNGFVEWAAYVAESI